MQLRMKSLQFNLNGAQSQLRAITRARRPTFARPLDAAPLYTGGRSAAYNSTGKYGFTNSINSQSRRFQQQQTPKHIPLTRQSRTMHSTSPNKSQAQNTAQPTHVVEASAAGEPTIHAVFETKTGTWQYVVADPSTSAAVIIDPVLDYDPATQSITTTSADSLLALVKGKGFMVEAILETHAHADHLTAASYLQDRLAQDQGKKPFIGIGKRIRQVQTLFGERYLVPEKEYDDIFGVFFEDDQEFKIGNLTVTAMHLPGHTPDHLGYKIGDNVFCGDSLFHADIGTARCDFPGGSASNLYQSGRRLLGLSDNVKIWTGHDYPPEGRSVPVPYMSVRDHKEQNKHLKDGITEEEFVALRKERDAKLGEPRLLHQSLQVNIRAGQLPIPTAAGHRMLHLPLKLNGVTW
ncbi:beta-lactamase-like protein [Aspergillus avenaceus]|uniref:Beta-lactamase-like protein n=1 Tax=Aspergillus avenaceus TaxID=36643 RepID=A0A5N6TTQ5_ASPAV|nr:beta-lactamase-like protein [Aspergillus avenaceus]